MNACSAKAREIECDLLVLCDVVRPYENRLHILAAGWDSIITPQLPARRELGVAVRLVGAPEALARPLHISVEVLGPTNGSSDPPSLAGARFDVTFVPEAEDYIKDVAVLLVPLRILCTFQKYGKHVVELTLNDQTLRTTHLWLIDPGDIPSED
jgi:hypothetical protein